MTTTAAPPDLSTALDRFAVLAVEHGLPPVLERAWLEVATAARITLLDRPPLAPRKGRFERSRSDAEAAERLERAGRVEEARRGGYTGDPCGQCGSFKMRRQGRCATCSSCGFNDGCG